MFVLLLFHVIFLAGKCPFTHDAAAQEAQLKADGFVACACEYQEGACKKETTVESGSYHYCNIAEIFPQHCVLS